jgi:hypothetical protein
MRGPLVSFAVVAIGIARATPAAAQLCHDLPPPGVGDVHGADEHAHGHAHAADGAAYGVGVQVEAASTVIDGTAAAFQGVALHAHVHVGRFALEAHAPAYRLAHAQGTERGLGDVGVAGWIRLYQRRALAIGAGVPVGIPTGDEHRGLGMGHVMLMPTAFVVGRRGLATVTAAAGYHHAIDPAEHPVGGIHGSVVSPMADRELAAATRATWWVAPALGAVAEAAVAIPLDEAPTRAAAGVGAHLRHGRVDIHAIVQLGLAGDPFRARGVLAVHVMR